MPLTTKEYLLIKVQEEAAEVSHIISKCLHFGLYDFHPKTNNTPNIELLKHELQDLYVALYMLEEEIGTLLIDNLNLFMCSLESRIRKARIEKYMKISRTLGILKAEEEE